MKDFFVKSNGDKAIVVYKFLMSSKNIESWLVRRYKNVSQILSSIGDKAYTVAWAIGAGALIIAYPLAISIIDDRFLAKRGIGPNQTR